MNNKKILLAFLGCVLSFSAISQDTLKPNTFSNDTLLKFSKEEAIDNITVRQISQKLYVESEYDSVIYYMYDHQESQSPFAIMPKNSSNFLDKEKFASMKIRSSFVDRKKVLEYHMYLKNYW